MSRIRLRSLDQVSKPQNPTPDKPAAMNSTVAVLTLRLPD